MLKRGLFGGQFWPPPFYTKKKSMQFKLFFFITRGKWGKVITRGKMIFQYTGFNIQMASFDKKQKLVLLPLDIF